MAKNARQRRAAKYNLAVRQLASSRETVTVASEGHVRSSASSPDALKVRTHTGFHASFKSGSAPRKSGVSRFKLDGFKPKIPEVFVVAPSDDAPEPVARPKPELSPSSRAHLAVLASVKPVKVDRD